MQMQAFNTKNPSVANFWTKNRLFLSVAAHTSGKFSAVNQQIAVSLAKQAK
jgi:hypothetical protein